MFAGCQRAANVQVMIKVAARSVVMKTVLIAAIAFAASTAKAGPAEYAVYVTNERSGDVTVIDGASDAVVATFPVGKRPRGLHASRDGKRVYVAVSGSPRMAPGVDAERAPADKSADGIGVIDVAARKVVEKWHAGSDPEQFSMNKEGALAFIANEDEASLSIVDLTSGRLRGKVKVSEEPEGVGVNPTNGEVYVTCEEKGEVFVVSPDEQHVLAKIEVGGRPRSVAFTPDGARAFVPSETGGYVSVIDTKQRAALSKIALPEGALPMMAIVSPDAKELYVTTGRANSVAVVDLTTNTISATIPVGGRVWGAALTPDGTKLYTANGASNDVSVVDVKARKEISRVKVGDGPWGIAIAPKL